MATKKKRFFLCRNNDTNINPHHDKWYYLLEGHREDISLYLNNGGGGQEWDWYGDNSETEELLSFDNDEFCVAFTGVRLKPGEIVEIKPIKIEAVGEKERG